LTESYRAESKREFLDDHVNPLSNLRIIFFLVINSFVYLCRERSNLSLYFVESRVLFVNLLSQLLVQEVRLELHVDFRKQLPLHVGNLALEQLEVHLPACQALHASEEAEDSVHLSSHLTVGLMQLLLLLRLTLRRIALSIFQL